MREPTDETVEGWLINQNQRLQTWFALRCALRAFPGISQLENRSSQAELAFVAIRAFVHASKLAMSSGRFEYETREKTTAAADLAGSSVAAFSSASPSATVASASAAARTAATSQPSLLAFKSYEYSLTAVSSACSFAISVADSEAERAAEAEHGKLLARQAAIADLRLGETRLGPHWHGLWHGEMPTRLHEGWLELKNTLLEREYDFQFWVGWYESLLTMYPLNWHFLEYLALGVTQSEWDAGPSTVARRVLEIQAIFDLKTKLAEFNDNIEKASLLNARHIIGGNNPPEDMQIEPQIVRETTIVWAAVDELKAETEKEAPDPTKLEKSAEAIESVKRSWGQFFAQKLEISTDEFFKEFGKWSGRLATASLPAGALLLLETLGKLEPLLQALRNYISILVG